MIVPDLDIVIVDFNAGSLVRDCIDSIRHHPPSGLRLGQIVVVDNASREPTRRFLEDAGGDVTILRNEVNRGFGAACNQGAALGRARHVLFLNPDTRVLRDSLARPVEYLDAPEHAGVGIAGIRLLDDEGRVTTSCYEFPRARHFLVRTLGLDRVSPTRFSNGDIQPSDDAEARSVDQVMGAFFMVRRPLFEALGGFDERFFVYFEEVDLAYRALQAGFSSVYLGDASATHIGCGTTDSIRATRLRLSLGSRLRFGRKHFSLPGQAGLFATTLLLEPLSRSALALLRRRPRELAEVWRAYLGLARELPDIVGGSRTG